MKQRIVPKCTFFIPYKQILPQLWHLSYPSSGRLSIVLVCKKPTMKPTSVNQMIKVFVALLVVAYIISYLFYELVYFRT